MGSITPCTSRDLTVSRQRGQTGRTQEAFTGRTQTRAPQAGVAWQVTRGSSTRLSGGVRPSKGHFLYRGKDTVIRKCDDATRGVAGLRRSSTQVTCDVLRHSNETPLSPTAPCTCSALTEPLPCLPEGRTT